MFIHCPTARTAPIGLIKAYYSTKFNGLQEYFELEAKKYESFPKGEASLKKPVMKTGFFLELVM